VLALQASAGNAAVGRMLARRATRRGVHASDATLTEEAIQGGTTFVRGEGDTHAIDPNDVVQGALNDCFVLAPMISIARFNPRYIMDMIRPTRGGWMVYLHRPVWWWHDRFAVFVDNRFWQRSGTPIYAQRGDEITGNVEMWPAILEKAVALARGGSYSNIDWGMTSEVMSMLTGEDTTARYLPNRDADDVLDDFVRAQRRGRAAVCNTKETYSGATQTLAQGLGVINKHSYAFVGANRDAQTVSLRDPNNVAHLPNLSIANLKALFDWAIFSDGYQ
jgi:Calpain family cysteine protease